MVRRLIAVGFIFVCATAAWLVLGAATMVRTNQQDRTLGARVAEMWGTPQTQSAPQVCVAPCEPERLGPAAASAGTPPRAPAPATAGLAGQSAAPGRSAAAGDGPGDGPRRQLQLASTRAEVGLSLEHRRKGLLWYSTYTVDFAAAYEVANPDPAPLQVVFDLPLPAPEAVYDRFRVSVGEEEVAEPRVEDGHVVQTLDLGPGERRTVRVAYRSHGLDEWRYRFGSHVEQVRDFVMVVRADFEGIDFPSGTVSPTDRRRLPGGWELQWTYDRLLTGADLGVRMPRRANPGEWVGRVSFAAPVSLFLFFAVLFLLTTARRVRLHPVHYAFLAAAFFAFHLLLAYLVDHVAVEWSLLIAALTSLALVVSYVRLFAGWRFALAGAGLAQLVYLVLFSCAFFLEGYAGLAITVLCVLTLFAAMQLTGRLSWEEVLAQ